LIGRFSDWKFWYLHSLVPGEAGEVDESREALDTAFEHIKVLNIKIIMNVFVIGCKLNTL
jgi:hypothetical protein